MPTVLTWSAHRALLDPLAGCGVLVLPLPGEDVGDPLATLPAAALSVHEAEQAQVLAHLRGLGWEPLDDEDDPWGGWQSDGCTADGREVVSLVEREPSADVPFDVLAAAVLALHDEAGTVLP